MKAKKKLFIVFAGHITVYLENPRKPTEKLKTHKIVRNKFI
jgi:hypothetical protein